MFETLHRLEVEKITVLRILYYLPVLLLLDSVIKVYLCTFNFANVLVTVITERWILSEYLLFVRNPSSIN